MNTIFSADMIDMAQAFNPAMVGDIIDLDDVIAKAPNNADMDGDTLALVTDVINSLDA
ncbi:hypothetical protein V5T82_10490 [Magnetovibrio sp. PR-2]|uniref:hypothetical protein n=1 Tax=Magnetovibrio sp. PR-2 TaxID=3120356 RepID=UPI002FCE47AC